MSASFPSPHDVSAGSIEGFAESAAVRRFLEGPLELRVEHRTRTIECVIRLVDDQDRAIALRLTKRIAVLDRHPCVAPGNFANALRQLRVTGEPASALRVAQLVAGEAALKPGARRNAFGFTGHC